MTVGIQGSMAKALVVNTVCNCIVIYQTGLKPLDIMKLRGACTWHIHQSVLLL